MKYAIVAYDKKRAIGSNNTIPWIGKMKSDMQHMRELTSNNAIIMGCRTFESIGKALPNRQNIVVSSRDANADGVTFVKSLDEAFAVVEPDRKPFIFGGSKIYESSLGDLDVIYATEIDTVVEGADAFFPITGPEWHETSREHYDADENNLYPFDFVTYEKS
ncbi:MAG: dihydrofolate reductase [Candidatus Saccharimonadales bacterium]